MNPLEALHQQFHLPRRARILAQRVAALLPRDASLLDVGTGDGRIAALIAGHRPDVEVRGIEVQVRESAAIPVEPFDGRTIPFGDGTFDAVSLIDVLHHAEDARRLLREARRVARRAVVIKDHTREGRFARGTLRLMDWVGNRRFGLAVPADYWTEAQWLRAFEELNLRPAACERRLGLYAWPATLVFDRALHFVVRCDLPG